MLIAYHIYAEWRFGLSVNKMISRLKSHRTQGGEDQVLLLFNLFSNSPAALLA